MPHLNDLMLGTNLLQKIDKDVFTFVHAVNLDLSFNRFEVLQKDRIPWNHLKRLRVHNNPWTCGCETKWLRKTLITQANEESQFA